MWSVYLDSTPLRTVPTRALGAVSRRAYYGPLAPLRARRIRDVALPGRRWVRVRNTLAGISARDLDRVHLQMDPRVSLAAVPVPQRVYLGEEVVGEVIDVGPEVEFFRVGDRVVYQLDQFCATRGIEPPCRHCAVGNFSLCENRFLPGAQAVGGGWSDEMVVHERQLFLVPDSLTSEQAALLHPTALSIHVALRHQPQPGDQVLVLGTETEGLLAIQAIRVLVPNVTITAQPTHAFESDFATFMGAARILSREAGGAGVARLTGAKLFQRRLGAELLAGGGFDVVYDTIGTAETLGRALRWVRDGGVIVLSGKRPMPLHLDLTPIWQREVTMLGALAHGTERWPGDGSGGMWSAESGGRVSSFALAAALLRERRLTPERLVTHRFPLREVRRAAATARATEEHQSIKVLLDIRELALDSEPTREMLPQEAGG